MSVTVENWYIVVSGTTPGAATNLHWWSRSAAGVSRGKDHLGREGSFAENIMQIRAWSEYDGEMFMFYGVDGRRCIAPLKTHYKNPRYPAQCVENKQALIAQLAGVPKN